MNADIDDQVCDGAWYEFIVHKWTRHYLMVRDFIILTIKAAFKQEGMA